MRTKRPVVWEDVFSHISTLDGGIRVDTPAWVAWLDAPTTTSFAYSIDNAARGYIEAFMTVRKERRRRGGAYWTAYSHVGGQMRKAYVGRHGGRDRRPPARHRRHLPGAPPVSTPVRRADH